VAVLPSLRLAGELPSAPAFLAVPTRPGEPVRVLGDAGPDVAAVLEREQVKGDAGELVALSGPAKAFLLGLGDGSPAALRKAGAALARKAKDSADLTLDLRRLAVKDDALQGLVEGLLLGSYAFTRKSKPPQRALSEIVLVVKDVARHQPAVARSLVVVAAVAAARDLVNTPPAEKSPAWLAKQAVGLLKGLEVRVRDEKDLAAEGWGGTLAVGMGSSRPPRVVEVTYRGGGRHVALVGKGITFDTGGISIKPNASMLTMKMDMGGAAAVLATVRAVADLGLPITVTAVACLAENMPSGSAQRPSDVIAPYGGTTVEVLNTDAEGRLVLADGLAYADTVLDPDVVVDVATLTGAMPVALGPRIAGLFTPDDTFAAQLTAASAATGERLWRMPLCDDYRQALDSGTADLRNIGDARLKLQGGSITAALFLQEFAGSRPWAHLDIAGPGWSSADDAEVTKGGTGYGVRLLVRWLEALAKKK
jgi:leucyl aminopeptidase